MGGRESWWVCGVMLSNSSIFTLTNWDMSSPRCPPPPVVWSHGGVIVMEGSINEFGKLKLYSTKILHFRDLRSRGL